MRNSFRHQVNVLSECVHRFDPDSNKNKFNHIKVLSEMPLLYSADLIHYFETLLFIIAYPSDRAQLLAAEKELNRITAFLKTNKSRQSQLFENSGMPFTPIVTRFSHDGLRWLLSQPYCTTTFHSFEESSLQLNDVLQLTLTSLEKSETTAGLSNMELLDELLVPKNQMLPFIVNELARLDHMPYIKDHLFDQLNLFVCVTPKNKTFSKGYNRLPDSSPYFTNELLKKFEFRKVLEKALPSAELLTGKAKEDVINVVKNSMAVTARETDPTTYIDESSLRLFRLERGVSISIYGMVPSRQLPLESYVGFTAFKNGLPVAYGGAWVFGRRANFGINIFESFRGGESGYVMAQVLRVYHQVFKIEYFEIEPYQFGLDNPEGIESGAFWFYYRFGFRPLDKTLLQISKNEYEKIKTKKKYKASHKTLIAFTKSNLALQLGKSIPPKVTDITSRVTRLIQRKYNNKRLLAESGSRQQFLANKNIRADFNEDESRVFTELALWTEAWQLTDVHQYSLLEKMIRTKPKDVYAYQHLLIKFFEPEIL